MCSLYAHSRKNLADKLTSVLSCQLAQNSSQSCQWLSERRLVRSLDNLCRQKQEDLEFEEIINELGSNIKELQSTLVTNQFNEITILKHIFEELESLKIIPNKEQLEDSESNAVDNQSDFEKQQPKSKSIYGEHLLAYLQEACLIAAKQASWKTEYIEHQHSVLDLLNNACERIMLSLQGKSNLFDKFDWRTRTRALESYTRKYLELDLRNEIEQEYKVLRRTPWGWLKKISGARQRPNALQDVGITELEIESYLLIWHCFDEIYALVEPDNTNRLPKPSVEQYQQMTSRYNQLRDRLKEFGKEIDSKEYIRKLKICSDAAKAYGSVSEINLSLDSLNSDDGKGITIDVPDETNINNIQTIAERELLIEEQKLLKSFLDKRLEELPIEQKNLLKLNSYGFTQFVIGQFNQMPQPKVSRRLKSIYKKIGKDFYEEYSAKNDQKDSPKELDAKELSRILEAFKKMVKFNLDESYKKEVDKLLAGTYINQVDESQELLHQETHENDEKYSDRLEPIKQCLLEKLQEQVKNIQFDIPTDAQEKVTETLSEFVEDWLEENSPQQITLIAEL
jgi:hypothetical protein